MNPGDVVFLKSGSVPMTVASVSVVDGDTRVTCNWVYQGAVYTYTWREAMLDLAAPRPAGFRTSLAPKPHKASP